MHGECIGGPAPGKGLGSERAAALHDLARRLDVATPTNHAQPALHHRSIRAVRVAREGASGEGVEVRLDSERLRYEMAIRGLNGEELARVAGVSKNTITHALQGREVNEQSLRRIASGLLTCPVLRMASELVARPPLPPTDAARSL
jgi:hypothetical protein